MKLSLVALGMLALVGCASRQLPHQNYGITETHMECERDVCEKVTSTIHQDGSSVTVRPIHGSTKVMGEIINVVPAAPVESDNPYETEEDRQADAEAAEQARKALSKAIEDAVKKDSCKCMPGDPLCSCL